MSKWLARARGRDGCLPPVPIVPKSPKLAPEVHHPPPFGTIGTFGTGGRHPNGHAEAALPGPDIDQEEREAIAVELGGVPPIYAPAFALIQAHSPADVPHDRWHQFVDDAGRFLDQWGRDAERLGWTVNDLFGLDPVKPMARYDNMGMLWMLKGESVVELTDTAARLSGGLAYRRRS